MSEQPTQTTPDASWTPPAPPVAAPAAPSAPETPAQSSQDQVAALEAQIAALQKEKADTAAAAQTKAADATPAAPTAPDFKVGQLVGYSEDYLGFDVARHGIVVAIEKSELADGSEKYFGRVVPLPAALHIAADELTVQD